MKRFLLVIMVLIVAALLILPSAALADPPPAAPTGDNPGSPTITQNITAVVWSDNPDVTKINNYNDNTNCGPDSFKLDSDKMIAGTHTYSDGTLTVTVTIDNDVISFDWSSANQLVNTVIVKSANNANVYTYSPNQTLDTGLHGPPATDKHGNLVYNKDGTLKYQNLSHIIFCYADYTPPVPEASTIILLSLGLLAVGGFVWYGIRQRKVAV